MLAVLVAMLPIIMEVESSSNARVCDNESRVKLSVLHGLNKHHRMKEVRIHEFEREATAALEETERKAVEAQMEVAKLQERVNKTYNEAEELVMKMENTTSPELEELEEQQICSDDSFVVDCCQVHKFRSIIILHIIIYNHIIVKIDKEAIPLCSLWNLCNQGSLFRCC